MLVWTSGTGPSARRGWRREVPPQAVRVDWSETTVAALAGMLQYGHTASAIKSLPDAPEAQDPCYRAGCSPGSEPATSSGPGPVRADLRSKGTIVRP
jgi:hypothetical protein